MKSLIPLYEHLLADATRWCCVSTLRDFKTITHRVEHEGNEFLTITLANFCRDFDYCLDRGSVSPTDFAGFARSGALPRFLGGLLEKVFDRSTGRLLDTPCIDSIFFVRQICLFAKKVEIPCSPKRNKGAINAYIECEEEVRSAARRLTKSAIADFDRVSGLLFGNSFNDSNRLVESYALIPKHGPGGTADKLRGNGKYNSRTWTRRLEENFFSSSEFLIPNYGYQYRLENVDFLEPGQEPPVQVVLVPKTLKTPRVIAMEPTHMQYAQQALMEHFVEMLEASPDIAPMIGFTDQGPNQDLARLGSMGGHLATLDLSEASDRVSLRLVSRLFRRHKSLLRAVMACRSKTAAVPGYGMLYLSKFASMGSALCFPVEAMVFLTVVFIGIEKWLNHPLRYCDLSRLRHRVRVYGDDIIVPTHMAPSVVQALTQYGLKVNPQKSFWTGKFRESCGSEWYAGVSVKPARLTKPLPNHRRDSSEFAAYVALRNQLYELGCWATTRYIDEQIGRLAPFPVVRPNSQALGRITYLNQFDQEKWCPKLHKWLVKAAVVVSRLPRSTLDDVGALMKFFLKRGDSPSKDSRHLIYSGRPQSVDTRLRWVDPT